MLYYIKHIIYPNQTYQIGKKIFILTNKILTQ